MTCSIPVEVAENSMVIVAQTDVVIDSGGGGGGGGNYQEKSVSYTPTESQQTATVTPGAGYDALSKVNVTVDAVSPYYIGSEIDRRSSSDMTVSGKTVLVPAGYYSILAAKSVADGTEGTPTATKGAVSNHSVSVTPSVVNSAGYIAGGTKSGTPVTVSASELVSGNLPITQNGNNIDVTNYETVSVNVSGGGGVPTLTFDFTKNSLADEETGFFAFSLHGANVALSSSGVTVSGTQSCARLFNVDLKGKVVTLYMGAVNSSLSSGHQRLVMFNQALDRGLVMQNSATWKFYNGTWVGSYGTEKNKYSNAKLTFEFDTEGKMNFYVNDTLTASDITMTTEAIGLASSTTGLYSATYKKVIIQTREQALLDGLLGGS